MSGVVIVTLEDALRAWARGVLPGPWNGEQTVIWGDQNAPKPGGNQIELRRGNPFIMRPAGRDVRGPVDEDTGSAPREGVREINWSVRAYNSGALQVLEDLLARLDDEDSTDALFGGALAIVDVSAVFNLTKLYGAQYKEVGGVDLRFRTHSLREGADAEAGVGYITQVNLEIKTKDVVGTLLATEVLQVGPVP